MLKVESLEYSYRSLMGKKLFGIEDINFEMEPGYIYGLVGRNGAGKTTLIKAILRGNYKKGEVTAGNLKMSRDMVRVKENMGFIMYPEMMFHNRTACENGEILGTLYPGWNRKAYEEKLREFGVDMDMELYRLSKGNVMKVMAAFAWGHRPKILFADEPTAGFDPVFRKEFLRFLQEYVEDGEHSVLISTHITEDLDKVADYLFIMEKGKLILNVSMAEIQESYRMIRCSKEELESLKKKQPACRVIGERNKGNQTEILLQLGNAIEGYEMWIPQISEILRCMTVK